MPNSKTIVQTILAAFCAILSAHISALGGGGMIVGARTGCWAKSGGVPTALDYAGARDAKEGRPSKLIHLWHAPEVSGWGIHNDDGIWKDLVGGCDLNIGSLTLGDDFVFYDNITSNKTFTTPVLSYDDFTFECVIDRTDTTANFCIFGFGFSTSRLFTASATTIGCRFSTGYETFNDSSKLGSYSFAANFSAGKITGYAGTTMRRTFLYFNSPSGRTAININGENSYGNYRNKFKAKCFRMYKGLITDEERANNFAVDNAIFGTIG